LGIISINETYIITPAENPKEIDKKEVLVFLVKNAKKLPIPVAKPANVVNKNAIATLLIIYHHQYSLFNYFVIFKYNKILLLNQYSTNNLILL
jgi:hypothetical protein